MGLGISELLIILVIILIIFGAGKLPELGDGIGRGIKNFRKAVKPEEIDVTPRPEERDADGRAHRGSESPADDRRSVPPKRSGS